MSECGQSKSESGRLRKGRRAFLGVSLATTAGALLLSDGAGPARAEWCWRPVYPLAQKTLSVVRGDLPEGTWATVRLMLRGPDGSSREVSTCRIRLNAGVASVPLELAYAHPERVPGSWSYVAVVEAGGRRLQSPPASYAISKFRFGV